MHVLPVENGAVSYRCFFTDMQNAQLNRPPAEQKQAPAFVEWGRRNVPQALTQKRLPEYGSRSDRRGDRHGGVLRFRPGDAIQDEFGSHRSSICRKCSIAR